ncbi:MAG: ATP-binding cassette domain-containing protein [Proteobacteria bacterium]|nr:ATP-binding cassette domain-containing protein [Pseudomonadota bacterium]
MTVDYAIEAKRRPRSNDLRPLARLLPFLSQYRLQVVIALLALLVAAAATLVVPIAVRRVLDHGFSAADSELVNQYFGMMLAVVAMLALGSAVRFYFVMWIGERVVADVRDHLFRHLTLLSPSFYEQQRTGEVISRLTADTTQIKAAFSSTASIALRNLVMLTGALIMMVYTSPQLSGLAALAIPGIVLPLVIFGRRVRSLSRRAQDTLANSAAFAQERLSAIATVQANVQEQNTVSAFSAATTSAFRAAAKRGLARALLTFCIIFLATGSIVGLLWYGAQGVIAGTISGGTLSQFILYAVFAASSLGQLSEVWGEVQLAAGASERIAELLEQKPSIEDPAAPWPLPKPAKGQVSFSKVSFHYPSRPDIEVLHKVSFEARPGEVVAVVGPSGAGKSTLFGLLQRFYEPQDGSVTLDGVEVRSLALKDLRGAIAIVPQDPVIFSGSIADNIRFGKPDASDAEVKEAARAARVDHFVRDLPKGYETALGERGVTLSGGQRQRVAIARAILRDAPVLLLDEATSALDAESEAMVQEALEHVSKGRTTIVIAHRLATVRNADRIVVLDKGRRVAEGTHAELIKKSPLYAKLAKLQFSIAA